MKVIIIGAGVAGLSIAWRLAEAGAQPIVLERGQPGQGATWAAAGMLAATAETARAPASEAAFARHAMALWPDFARAIEETAHLPIRYRQDGALLTARNGAEAEMLKARVTAGLEFLAPEAALARVPGLAPDIAGALWAPQDGQVDNRALGRALATALLRAGGTLRTNEAAVRIEAAPDGVMVLTPFSRLEADAVVLAAGAWSSQIYGLPPEAVPPVRAVKGEMIALRPPAGTVLPSPLIWGQDVYLVPREPLFFVGATVSEVGYDTALTEDAQDWLLTRAEALMPGLSGWEVAEHWAGLRPGSPDGLPLIGATLAENVYVASGQYRNGILFAPAMAEAVTALVLKQHVLPDIAAFDPMRFNS